MDVSNQNEIFTISKDCLITIKNIFTEMNTNIQELEKQLDFVSFNIKDLLFIFNKEETKNIEDDRKLFVGFILVNEINNIYNKKIKDFVCVTKQLNEKFIGLKKLYE